MGVHPVSFRLVTGNMSVVVLRDLTVVSKERATVQLLNDPHHDTHRTGTTVDLWIVSRPSCHPRVIFTQLTEVLRSSTLDQKLQDSTSKRKEHDQIRLEETTTTVKDKPHQWRGRHENWCRNISLRLRRERGQLGKDSLSGLHGSTNGTVSWTKVYLTFDTFKGANKRYL